MQRGLLTVLKLGGKMTNKEKKELKDGLREYLLSVLADEEYYNTLKHCKAEALRVNSWEFNHGCSLKRCCSDWLRGLPIGVEFGTWRICVKIFHILGWKYDPLFSLGKMTVEVNGKKRKYDTFDLDTIYWDTLGEIIAEE